MKKDVQVVRLPLTLISVPKTDTCVPSTVPTPSVKIVQQPCDCSKHGDTISTTTTTTTQPTTTTSTTTTPKPATTKPTTTTTTKKAKTTKAAAQQMASTKAATSNNQAGSSGNANNQSSYHNSSSSSWHKAPLVETEWSANTTTEGNKVTIVNTTITKVDGIEVNRTIETTVTQDGKNVSHDVQVIQGGNYVGLFPKLFISLRFYYTPASKMLVVYCISSVRPSLAIFSVAFLSATMHHSHFKLGMVLQPGVLQVAYRIHVRQFYDLHVVFFPYIRMSSAK